MSMSREPQAERKRITAFTGELGPRGGSDLSMRKWENLARNLPGPGYIPSAFHSVGNQPALRHWIFSADSWNFIRYHFHLLSVFKGNN